MYKMDHYSLITPEDWIATYSRTKLKQHETLELEYRLQTFYGDRLSNDIGKYSYNRLLNKLLYSGVEYSQTMITDQVYDVGKDRYRHSQIVSATDGHSSSVYLIKKSIKSVNDPNYGFTLNMSIEDTSLTKEVFDSSMTQDSSVIIRHKNRYSFKVSPYMLYDLTLVTSTTEGSTKERYEFEVEYTGTTTDELKKYLSRSPREGIYSILSFIRESSIPWSRKHITDVNRLLVNCLGTSSVWDIIGKARNLDWDDLLDGGIVGNKVEYLASIKADGVHKLLIISDIGVWLVMGDEFNLIEIPNKKVKTMIFDGEEVPLANRDDKISQYYYIIFDTLYADQMDYRSKHGMQRYQRSLNHQLTQTPLLSIKVIPQIKLTKSNFFATMNSLLNDKYEYLTDGLIIKPDQTQYQIPFKANTTLLTTPALCKWKDPEDMTIDLKYEIMSDGGMLVTSSGDKFKGSSKYPFSGAVDWKEFRPINGSIYEFRVRFNDLVAIRVRIDKLYPNANHVVEDTWKRAHEGIEKDDITGKNNVLLHKTISHDFWSTDTWNLPRALVTTQIQFIDTPTPILYLYHPLTKEYYQDINDEWITVETPKEMITMIVDTTLTEFKELSVNIISDCVKELTPGSQLLVLALDKAVEPEDSMAVDSFDLSEELSKYGYVQRYAVNSNYSHSFDGPRPSWHYQKYPSSTVVVNLGEPPLEYTIPDIKSSKKWLRAGYDRVSSYPNYKDHKKMSERRPLTSARPITISRPSVQPVAASISRPVVSRPPVMTTAARPSIISRTPVAATPKTPPARPVASSLPPPRPSAVPVRPSGLKVPPSSIKAEIVGPRDVDVSGIDEIELINSVNITFDNSKMLTKPTFNKILNAPDSMFIQYPSSEDRNNCLIHSFLTLISTEFRSSDRLERNASAVKFREALATWAEENYDLLPEYAPLSKEKTVAQLRSKEFLGDETFRILVNVFNVGMVLLSSTEAGLKYIDTVVPMKFQQQPELARYVMIANNGSHFEPLVRVQGNAVYPLIPGFDTILEVIKRPVTLITYYSRGDDQMKKYLVQSVSTHLKSVNVKEPEEVAIVKPTPIAKKVAAAKPLIAAKPVVKKTAAKPVSKKPAKDDVFMSDNEDDIFDDSDSESDSDNESDQEEEDIVFGGDDEEDTLFADSESEGEEDTEQQDTDISENEDEEEFVD